MWQAQDGCSLLSILGDIFSGNRAPLVKLAAVLGGNAQFPASIQKLLGQLRMIDGIVAVKEGFVASLDDEAGDVHGGWETDDMDEAREIDRML